jgi:hypothetical protein
MDITADFLEKGVLNPTLGVKMTPTNYFGLIR